MAFVTGWGGVGWDQHSPTQQMQQGTQWKPPRKKNEKRELACQMALLDFHFQSSHLIKPWEVTKMLDPALREKGFTYTITHNQLILYSLEPH